MAYENEAILAAQNDEGFEYVLPDTTLLIENAGAILKDASAPSQAWLDFVLSDEGQKQFALTGFRPIRDDVDYGGTVEGATDPSNPFPEVPTPAHRRRRLRWLGRGVDEVLRRGERPDLHRHPAAPASRSSELTDLHMTSTEIARGPTGEDSSPVGPALHADAVVGLGLGIAMIWFSALVLIPLIAVVVTAHRRRLDRLLEHHHQRPDPGRHPAHGLHRRWASRSSTSSWARSSRGSWCATASGASGPRGDDRHPVRPADDRRRPGAALALRHRQPAGHRHRQRASGRLPRLPVRHAPVRRPHGPAGAGGARRATSRRPRPPWARAGSPPSGASSCRA